MLVSLHSFKLLSHTAPGHQDLLGHTGGIKAEVGLHWRPPQIILFPAKLTCIVQNIGLTAAVAKVGYHSDVFAPVEDHNVTGLPLVNIRNITGQLQSVSLEEGP